LSADPIGIEDGVNVYGYCWGSPINFIDSDGKSPESTVQKYIAKNAWENTKKYKHKSPEWKKSMKKAKKEEEKYQDILNSDELGGKVGFEIVLSSLVATGSAFIASTSTIAASTLAIKGAVETARDIVEVSTNTNININPMSKHFGEVSALSEFDKTQKMIGLGMGLTSHVISKKPSFQKKSKELTLDEQYEQMHTAIQKKSVKNSGIQEVFSTPNDALGNLISMNGRLKKIDIHTTKLVDLSKAGFRKKIIYQDSESKKFYSVFFNEKTREYTGGHESSHIEY